MTTTFKYSLEGQQTERLLFRRVEESDFNTWLAFIQDKKSTQYIFDKTQQAIEDPIERCRIWFNRVYNRYENGLGGMNALIDKNTGAFIGQCGLLIQEIDGLTELEIGYSIMPLHHNKGFATEAAKKCKLFAFENNFSPSLISVIHVENEASAKVALKNGMSLSKTTVSKGEPVNIFRIFNSNNL